MLSLQERDTAIAVINDELILQSVCKEHPDEENADAVHVNGTAEFTELKVLTLSFKNIFKMDNLVTLKSLVSLKLDNNVIQKIEGIGHLVNLVWLDLSFNNISTIEGLDKLRSLSDLTLFNNNISKLENLENLTNLQVFSIGNNQLSSTDGLLYLRQIETLRVLNLEGNPVCSDAEYRPFVLAHLDKLKYLDYVLVDNMEVQLAREQYQDELEEFREKKMLSDATKKREREMEEYTRTLKEANVYVIETLFSDMFKEDSEFNKLSSLPGLSNIKEDYSEKVKQLTETVKSGLLEKHEAILKAKSEFVTVSDELKQTIQHKSIESHEHYRRQSKKLFKEIRSANDTAAGGSAQVQVSTLLTQARLNCEKLCDELMSQESELVDQAHDLLDHLEGSVETIATEIRDTSTEHFRAVEDLENAFYESVTQLASQLLERMAAEDADDDDLLSDECRAVLTDRDGLNNTISGSHDIHIGKLLAQEDLKREQANTIVIQMIKSARDAEWNRNRARVAEIMTLKEKQLREIGELKEEAMRAEDEYY